MLNRTPPTQLLQALDLAQVAVTATINAEGRLGPVKGLWPKLKKAAGTEKQQKRMLKDWPLIEAARATDDCIASLDNDARALFARASVRVPVLKTIVWVNPERPEEAPLPWLEHGAMLEPRRMLGASGQGAKQ